MNIGALGLSPSATSLLATMRGTPSGGAPPVNLDFVSTWDTTKAGSASNTVVLPLLSGGIYSGNIDWGDGSSDDLSYANKTHVYASSGIYTITIAGTIEGFGFYVSGDRLKIIDISNWGTLTITNGDSAFESCTNLNISAIDAPTFATSTLKDFFKSCTSLTTCDFSNWDTSVITSMETMFEGCTNFNGNIINWDVSNVTKFNRGGTVGMFSGCSFFNQNIGNWNVSSETNMTAMFSGCSRFNQDLSSWHMDNKTSLSGMFFSCIQFDNGGSDGINNWNVSNVTNFAQMFRFASVFNRDISAWNTSKAVTFNEMFVYSAAFNQPIGNWNTSLVTTMFKMIEGATSFNQDISSWDVNQVTNLTGFMSAGSGVSTANYDALLIAWDAQGAMAFSGTASFGNSKYTAGGAAEAARTSLISKWGAIIDGGPA